MFKVADKCHAIGVALLANTLLHILLPLPLEHKEVDVAGHSPTLPHIINPVPLVRLALDMSELAITVSPAKVPSTVISRPITELHPPPAMPEAAQPLAVINSPGRPILVLRNTQLAFAHFVEHV